MVIGATNYAERLDNAVLRPGRLDQHYYVGLPDFAARAELFRHHLNARPCDSMDWNLLARVSEGYSAADIELLATQAARLALIEHRNINTAHLRQAIEERPPKQIEPSRSPIGFGS